MKIFKGCLPRNLLGPLLNTFFRMIASIQATKTEIFAFIAVLVFKLLSRKILFLNRKGNSNC